MWNNYALVRLVPRPELPDGTSIGALVFCRQQRLLLLRWWITPDRLGSLWPDGDLPRVWRHLQAWERVARGDPQAGPLATLPPPERFRWLAAPRSTVLQPGPVHEAWAPDPATLLDRITRLHGPGATLAQPAAPGPS